MWSTRRTKPWSSTFCILYLPVQVPARLLKVFQPCALGPGAADIFDRVAQAEAQAPRLYDLDGFVRTIGAAVMGRVVNGICHYSHPLPVSPMSRSLVNNLQCRQPAGQWNPHSRTRGPVIKRLQAGSVTSMRCAVVGSLKRRSPAR